MTAFLSFPPAMDSKTKGRGRTAASAPTEEARKTAAKSKVEEVEEPEPEAEEEEEEAVEESESSSDHEDDDEAEPREDADGNDDPLADLSDAEDDEDLAAKLRREAEKYREALAQRGVVSRVVERVAARLAPPSRGPCGTATVLIAPSIHRLCCAGVLESRAAVYEAEQGPAPAQPGGRHRAHLPRPRRFGAQS